MEKRLRFWILLVGLVLLARPIMAADAKTDADDKGTNGQTGRPPGRLVVSILTFENETADSANDHWSELIRRLLSRELTYVRSLLVRGGMHFALEELGLERGSALSTEQARKMGEIIETHRVIWGRYEKKAGQWCVTLRVLNVATGEVSQDIRAQSKDWLEVRDRLLAGILDTLAVTPTAEERKKLGTHWTSSSEAMEAYSRALDAQERDCPMPEIEKVVREALEHDPKFIPGQIALASVLGSQGRFDEAKEVALQTRDVMPDLSEGLLILGLIEAFQNQSAEGERLLREALLLQPDDAETLNRLGQIVASQARFDEAIVLYQRALEIEPLDPRIHSCLGLALANKRNRPEAIESLQEATRLDVGDIYSTNVSLMTSQAYDLLGDLPRALEHYERLLLDIRENGIQPDMIPFIESRIEALKSMLKPVFVETQRPRDCTGREIEKVLSSKLTDTQRKLAINPLESSDAIRRWALELTADTENDFDKAKAIFDAMLEHHYKERTGGVRTAKQVFAVWGDPNERFNCQEYGKLFTVMAREAGLDAFFTFVDRDAKGRMVPHACACVFLKDRGALLVDPMYRWFGVPHEEYRVLDDVQAIALQLLQMDGSPEDCLEADRAAVTIFDDFPFGYADMANTLVRVRRLDEARDWLTKAYAIRPDYPYTKAIEGMLMAIQGNEAEAVRLLEQVIEASPDLAEGHFWLGRVMGMQTAQYESAREHLQTALRLGLTPADQDRARGDLARINESIGIASDTELDAVTAHLFRALGLANRGDPEQAVAEVDKALELDPNLAEGYKIRGFAKVKMGKYEEAIMDCSRAIELDATLTQARRDRAICYLQTQRYEKAIADCSRALEDEPEDSTLYLIRGDAWYRLKDYEASLADCNRAIEIDPREVRAYRVRGFVRIKTGDPDGATQDFATFKRLGGVPE